jgi:hypothetical protein
MLRREDRNRVRHRFVSTNDPPHRTHHCPGRVEGHLDLGHTHPDRLHHRRSPEVGDTGALCYVGDLFVGFDYSQAHAVRGHVDQGGRRKRGFDLAWLWMLRWSCSIPTVVSAATRRFTAS